jgi:aldose sugar dehydrogenase
MRPPAWFAWHFTASLLVMVAPVSLWLGEAPLQISVARLPQALTMGLAYWAAVALATRLERTASGRGLGGSVATLAAAFGAAFVLAYIFLLTRADLPVSRLVVALSAVLGMSLAALPAVLPRHRGLALGALVGALALLLGRGHESGSVAGPTEVRATVLGLLTLQPVEGLAEGGGGGALEPFQGGFLLVTGEGRFHWIERADDGATFLGRELDLPSPLDRRAFLDDQSGPVAAAKFRVADLIVDHADGPTLYVSHHHWDGDRACFTTRLSRLPLVGAGGPPERLAAGGEWSVVFEAEPCLEIMRSFTQSDRQGGRLHLLPDGRVMLSLGDSGFDGVHGPPLSQQADSRHGRLLAIDPRTGEHETLALGLRNPQGVVVLDDGRMWVSDQGPRGGDELNLVAGFANLGWPYQTDGTQYHMYSWPGRAADVDRSSFTEPAFVWVPSVALSSLIRLARGPIAEWAGDLVAGSLRGQQLHRIRIRGDRVVYVEPIPVGRRVRDVVEADDGALVLWTDEGDLVLVAESPLAGTGEAVYARCAVCHEAGPGGAAAAPPLRGLFLRPVAAVPDFTYSATLREAGGHWEMDRLRAFLRDPQGAMPGTTMDFEGLEDPAELQALMEFLRSY